MATISLFSVLVILANQENMMKNPLPHRHPLLVKTQISMENAKIKKDKSTASL